MDCSICGRVGAYYLGGKSYVCKVCRELAIQYGAIDPEGALLPAPSTLTEDDLCQIAKENRDLIPIVTELAAELREDFAITYSLGNGQFEGLEGHLWGLVHMARAEVGDSVAKEKK